MADPLRGAAPVGGAGGFAGRPPAQEAPPRRPTAPSRPAGDQVSLGTPANVVRRLLRERVLAATRLALSVPEQPELHPFAEVIDGETAAMFVGRLVSAQNQIAALAAARVPAATLRLRLDTALRTGIEDTLSLLADNGRDETEAVAIVAEVFADYARLVAAQVEPPTP